MAEPIRVDSVSRRTVLKGIAGAAGLVSIPAIIAACSSTASSGAPASGGAAASGGATGIGNLSVGSYNSDPAPKQGMADINTAFKTATGITVGAEHGRPQHVPGPDLQLPGRHARHRIHLVLRASG